MSFQLSALSLRLSPLSLRLSAFSLELSALSFQLSALSLELSALSLQLSALSLLGSKGFVGPSKKNVDDSLRGLAVPELNQCGEGISPYEELRNL